MPAQLNMQPVDSTGCWALRDVIVETDIAAEPCMLSFFS